MDRLLDVSLPFDKYKAKEDMERRLEAKNTLIFNERLS
jgi:hypothetical protein